MGIEIKHKQGFITEKLLGSLSEQGVMVTIYQTLSKLIDNGFFINSHTVFELNGRTYISVVYSEPSVISETEESEQQK